VTIDKDVEVNINSIDIIDIRGRSVLSLESPANQFDISNLPLGTYFFIFDTNEGRTTRSLIKK
jgi:hypothetical protein